MQNYRNGKWVDQILSQRREDGLWGNFHTDCYFAPVSHRHTSLQHNQSPKSIGGSLQGSLAITLTRLSLAS